MATRRIALEPARRLVAWASLRVRDGRRVR